LAIEDRLQELKFSLSLFGEAAFRAGADEKWVLESPHTVRALRLVADINNNHPLICAAWGTRFELYRGVHGTFIVPLTSFTAEFMEKSQDVNQRAIREADFPVELSRVKAALDAA
jgi:hypothetical protein